MKDAKKVLNLLSLTQRAGKLESGEFRTEKAVKEGRAHLVIIAQDASDNTKKKFYNMCSFYQTETAEQFSMEELGRCTGRSPRSVMALTDEGLTKAVLVALDR